MKKTTVGPNDNIFEVIGDDPQRAANLLMRSQLMILLTEYVRDEGLSLRKAGKAFGITHSRVNDLMQGRIDLFTIDYLVNMAVAVGMKVTIDVQNLAEA